MGFANPDNLDFDSQGNLWVVTDMSTSTHNNAVPQRQDEAGKALSDKDLLGLYGNNSLWQIITQGDQAGEAKMFAYGPMECELTGPFFTADGRPYLSLLSIRANGTGLVRRWRLKCASLRSRPQQERPSCKRARCL